MTVTAEQRAAIIRKQRVAAGVEQADAPAGTRTAAQDTEDHANARASGKSWWDSIVDFFKSAWESITGKASDGAADAKDGAESLWERLKKLFRDSAGDWKSLLGGIGGIIGGWVIGTMFGGGIIGKIIGGLLAVAGFFMGRDLMHNMFGNGTDAPGSHTAGTERSGPTQNVQLGQQIDALSDRMEAIHRSGEKAISKGLLDPSLRAKMDQTYQRYTTEIDAMEAAAGKPLSAANQQRALSRITELNTLMDGWLVHPEYRKLYEQELQAVKAEQSGRSAPSSARETISRAPTRADTTIDTATELQAVLVEAQQKAQVAQQVLSRQQQTHQITDKQAQRQMATVTNANQTLQRVASLSNLSAEQITIAAREVQQAEQVLDRIGNRDPLTRLEVQQGATASRGFVSQAPMTTGVGAMIDPTQVASPQNASLAMQYAPAPVGGSSMVDPLTGMRAVSYRQ